MSDAAREIAAYAAAVAGSTTRPPLTATSMPAEFAHLSGLERLQGNIDGTIPPPPSWYLLGWRLVEVSERRAVFEFAPQIAHASYAGTVHGGILAALADSAMGCATLSCLPPDSWCATQHLSTYFLRPVKAPGPLVMATGTVRSRGRSTAMVEAVLEQEGLEALTATSSYAIRHGRQLPGQPPA